MDWISAYQQLPEQEREIVFIADEDQTDERIGIAIPKERIILLRRTEMHVKHLRWWFYMPDPPGSKPLNVGQDANS